MAYGSICCLITAIIALSFFQVLYIGFFESIKPNQASFPKFECKQLPRIFNSNTDKDLVVEVSKEPYGHNNCFLAKSFNNSYDKLLFCYPSIIVMGFPKCGTSYLFKMLSKHPKILATRRKELCIGGIMSETWEKFFSRLPSPEEVRDRYVMSGCLHLGANEEAVRALCVSNTRYLFLVRDVADMLWGAYNYWCLSGHDTECVPGGRTVSTAVRTPLHFHHLMATNHSLGGGLPLDPSSGNCFKDSLLEAMSVYGRKQILVIKSEDLLSQSSLETRNRTFSMITEFLSLSPSLNHQWMDQMLSRPVAVNSGHSLSSRGEFVEHTSLTGPQSVEEDGRGVYEVSGYQPMLQETRELVYRRWREECLWLHITWDIAYEACH